MFDKTFISVVILMCHININTIVTLIITLINYIYNDNYLYVKLQYFSSFKKHHY